MRRGEDRALRRQEKGAARSHAGRLSLSLRGVEGAGGPRPWGHENLWLQNGDGLGSGRGRVRWRQGRGWQLCLEEGLGRKVDSHRYPRGTNHHLAVSRMGTREEETFPEASSQDQDGPAQRQRTGSGQGRLCEAP